ncbi:helix-turn-helix domain-containing protein [Amorphus sp. MBR-141]
MQNQPDKIYTLDLQAEAGLLVRIMEISAGRNISIFDQDYSGLKIFAVETGSVRPIIAGHPPLEMTPDVAGVAWRLNPPETAVDDFTLLSSEFSRIIEISVEFSKNFEFQEYSDTSTRKNTPYIKLIKKILNESQANPLGFISAPGSGMRSIASAVVRMSGSDRDEPFLVSLLLSKLICETMENIDLSEGVATKCFGLPPSIVKKVYFAHNAIARSPADAPSLSVMAEDMGLTKRELSAGFRRLFGESFSVHVQNIRLDESYRLLEQGNLSIALVAERVGYSPTDFYLRFFRRFGCAPRTIRTQAHRNRALQQFSA